MDIGQLFVPYSVYDFWVWCSGINLAVLLGVDVIENRWSPPRDYAGVILCGPIFTIIFLYKLYHKLKKPKA